MPDTDSAVREEWARDVQVLRECRALQKQVAALGLQFPILDLLVARGRLGRDIARRGLPPEYRFPGDPCTRHPEARVLARVRAAGSITEEVWRTVEAALRGFARLKVPATTVGLLVRMGHLRPADLAGIEREIDGEDDAGRDAPPEPGVRG
ncbi:MAG: hypothetical protein AAB434_05985 [Planctomycetota bacterium]